MANVKSDFEKASAGQIELLAERFERQITKLKKEILDEIDINLYQKQSQMAQ